jgi:EAL domain-containing protein (putative c-di-GMP-specific phosphodiesterase class I)
LRSRGIRISVDDFGAGYSALGYLKQLPLSSLKIDQSFIRDATNDSSTAAIVDAIVVLAHNLQLNVVAEGVREWRPPSSASTCARSIVTNTRDF